MDDKAGEPAADMRREMSERMIKVVELCGGLPLGDALQMLGVAGGLLQFACDTDKTPTVNLHGRAIGDVYTTFNREFDGDLKPPTQQ